MLLTLCVHNRFLSHFAMTNSDVIASLEKTIQLEVLTETQEKISFRHRAAGLIGGAEYNQSLAALLRHAKGKYIMFADASDWLQAGPILKAIRLLEKKDDTIAVAGGIRNLDHAFLTRLAPQGVLMRREEACRFLHAMEYDLVGCWHSLAQLACHGEVLWRSGRLSERRHSHCASLPRVDARDLFYNISFPERYIGEVCLYDPVTLERYLSDAEKFLLFWPSWAGISTQERTKRMFKKRAALYATASKQAISDGNASMHLHFRLRRKMMRHRSKNDWLADYIPHFLRKEHVDESILQQAVAEQLRLEASLLGEKVMLYMENAPGIKGMQKNLGELPVQWLDRELLLAKSVSAEELVVFFRNEDVRNRLLRTQAQPGRHFAYESLRRLLAPE